MFPAEAQARARVEEAERWGETVLQPVPRRLIRRGLRDHLSQRQWFADVASPFPAPQVMGALLTPLVPVFIAQAGATPERVTQDLVELPALLDHVDELLAQGTIGGPRLNAADWQIGTTVRMLLAFLEAGYADRLLLSSDYNFTARSAARPGYGSTLTVFVPKLREAGVKDETIRRITVDNPRRFLAFVPKNA